MSDRHYEEKKGSFSGRLTRFLQRYRLVFVVLAAAVLIFPIAYYVVDTIHQKYIADGAKKMFEIKQKQDEYRTTDDKDKKAAAKRELFALIDEAANQFGASYAGAYALLMRAGINYGQVTSADTTDKKTPVLAVIQDLGRIVANADDNILVPLALKLLTTVVQNLGTLVPASFGGEPAIGLDEVVKLVPGKALGEGKAAKTDDVAFALCRYLVDRYPKSLYAPEALVNMGFMLEARGDYKAADETYGRLESEYGNNLWTKMAVNRKLDLETGGKVTP